MRPRISVALLSLVLCVPLGAILDSAFAAAPAASPDEERAETADTVEPPDDQTEEDWDVSNPPGEWRSVTIDTTETTWSNVDVSPDGETLLFDMLGDLYTVPIAGGMASALTEGIEWNIQGRYSPDGTEIAFISDRDGADNIWVMAADGSDARQVSSESEDLIYNPWWSPDGDYIVAKKGIVGTRSIPGGEIWLYHASGGDGVQLVERSHGPQSQKNLAEPSLSVDGRYLFYSQDTTPGRVWQYNKDSTGQIFVVQRLDLETGVRDTFASGPGGAIRPTPSPDGTRLAFVKRVPGLTSALYLKDLESGKEWAIHRGLERDLQETNGNQGNYPAFAWTPDSRAIVFWSGGGYHRIDVESRQVTEIPVRITTERRMQETLRVPVEVAPDEAKIRMLRWAQYTPDRSRVVFQALGHLWVHEVASGERRRLTRQSDHWEFHPRVSRDGRRVVYTTWSDQGLGSVRVVPIGGGEGRTLTENPGHYVEPAFSPDGETVVFRKITGGYLLSPLWSLEPGLYRVPADGSAAPERILDRGARPHFGAREDRIYFAEDGEDQELILKSVNLSGHDELTHARGTGITEFEVSPDGRWVGFRQSYDAFVAAFPRAGGALSLDGSGGGLPVSKVSGRSGEFLHWSADGTTLSWANGATLYSRRLNDAFGFFADSPEELPEPAEEGLDLGFAIDADRPSGMLALTGARVVTMRGARDGQQEVIDNGVVLVEGNRITTVGPAAEVAVPEEATVVELDGRTIVPGFIDVHAHGAMARSGLQPQQNWLQYSNLAFGVTTIHDPSNDTASIFSAAELQRAGLTLAPRIFSTGTILYGARVPGFSSKVDSLDDARFHVRRLNDVGAFTVKSYQQPRRDQRQQILAAARELGVMVVPEGGMNFQHNMTEIIDGHTGIEHSLSLARGYEDVLQLWSQSGTGYSPTFGVAFGGMSGEFYWYDRTEVWKNERLLRYVPRFLVEPRAIRRQTAPDDHYNHIDVARFAKALRDRGVGVMIGAHGQREGLASHWEMWMMEQGGMSPWEALRGGTLDGAWYLGLDGDIGSIEPGKLADLVVIDGDPLVDLKRSEYVTHTMINGRLYDVSTMTQIGSGTSTREPFFFELEGGDTLPPATSTWLRRLGEQHGWVHGETRP